MILKKRCGEGGGGSSEPLNPPLDLPLNSHMTRTQSIATSSLFLGKMIAKLERTLSTALQNKYHTQNPHKQWDKQ